MSDQKLLIPVKIEALVIDRRIIGNKDFCQWSNQGPDYKHAAKNLWGLGPQLFFGDNPPGSPRELPTDKQCGVYLHWVLPDGLRYAHQFDGTALNFPPIPDQWLLLRISRQGEAPPQQRAWFIDSSLRDAAGSTVMLIVPDETSPTGHKAVGVGHEPIPLEDYQPASADASPTTRVSPLTATGNSATGSPTFTAFTAENQNILSCHDDLSDLADGNGNIPAETVLSYGVVGWYRDPNSEILAWVKEKLTEGKKDAASVLAELGWQVGLDPEAAPPDDLLQWQALFHGLVTHINYWHPDWYWGGQLGYPGAPPANEKGEIAAPPIKVGVGNNGVDALIALAHDAIPTRSKDENTREADSAAMWKALEAVIYRQVPSLHDTWRERPREFVIHQDWYHQIDGGHSWQIVPQERDENSLAVSTNKDNGGEKALYNPRPTPNQLRHLQELNQSQREADQLARQISSWQQEVYAQWWVLAYKNIPWETFSAQTKKLEELKAPLSADLQNLKKKATTLRTNQAALQKALQGSGLELKYSTAPRFWEPLDPVVVISNIGHQHKHEFPNPLLCRPDSDLLAKVQIVGEQNAAWQRQEQESTAVAPLIETHFGALVKELISEMSLLETAFNHLAHTIYARPPQQKELWLKWLEDLDLIIQASRPGHKENNAKQALRTIKSVTERGRHTDISLLVRYWEKQPWSPLYLDWQITYYPTKEFNSDLGPTWRFEGFDYQLSGALETEGIQLSGRSLMAPLLGKFFTDPVDELQKRLLSPAAQQSNSSGEEAVKQLLSSYVQAWRQPLQELVAGGVLGQSLSGFHHHMLGRDSRSPRIAPDPRYPWVQNPDPPGNTDSDIAPLMATVPTLPNNEPLVLPNLPAPARPGEELPFKLLHGGRIQLDRLWVIDDFGQFFDVLGDKVDKRPVNYSPHMQEGDLEGVIRPRILQPTRLSFRFSAEAGHDSGPDPDSSPICGWISANYLDQALMVYASSGQLLGELLMIDEDSDTVSVRWHTLSTPAHTEIDDIADETLRRFVQGLNQPPATGGQHPLQELLVLIDNSLAQIIPAGGNRRSFLFTRPLALVRTTLQLELYGRDSWRSPQKPGEAATNLTGLRLPVRLGYAPLLQDGLIGYYHQNELARIIPAHHPGIENSAGSYVGDADSDALTVGYDTPATVTLLMEPYCSVHAAVGILPAKSILLPGHHIKEALENMELSFRAAPVLWRKKDTPSAPLPVPAIVRGKWFFTQAGETPPLPAEPPGKQPNYTTDPPLLSEGRLVLRSNDNLPPPEATGELTEPLPGQADDQ